MDTLNLETALKNASGLIDQRLGEVLVVPDAPEGRVIEATPPSIGPVKLKRGQF